MTSTLPIKTLAVEPLSADGEQRWRRMFENAPVGIALCDAGGRFLEANVALLALLGLDAESLTRRTILDVVPPMLLPEGRRLDDEIAASPSGVYKIERRFRAPDGEVRWLRVTANLARTRPGEPRRIVAFFEDVSARMAAQERLASQAALLDMVPDAIFVVDMEDRVRYWSKGAERLYGWTAAEMLGQPLATRLNRERPAALDEAETATLTRYAWSGQLRRLTQSGKDLFVESRWNLMRDEGGSPVGILVIDTDVTERSNIEAQLFRTQRLESIGLLAGGVAHDINNILTPILMATGLLRRTLEDATSLRLLQTIENKVQLGAGLVKQILHFSRGVTGERTPLQVRHLVLELEKFARDTFPRSITIRSDAPKDVWTVHGDATQLYQVLMNLCVNARDAMPDGGMLMLQAENLQVDELFARMHPDAQPGPYIVLTVTDSGTGIPADVQKRIFEPFFTTKAVGEGTGLGLSTTLGIVKSHGGFITLTSSPGAGAQFKVYLPAADAGPVDTAAKPRAHIPEARGRCVLVVDDERDIREVAEAALGAWGYRVLTAADGAEAVAVYAANKGQVDVVLLDLAMPYLDGAATLRALRKLDPGVKVVVSSGLQDRSATVAEVPFLAKPFTADALLEQIGLTAEGETPTQA